jgi:C4-dicarboxylate transporter DctQ subunit
MNKTLLDQLAWLLSIVVGVIFSCIIVLVSGEVFSRYFFHSSIRGAYEIAQYLCIWMTFLGVGVALRRAELISIDFIKRLLPPKIGNFITTIVTILMIGFLVITIRYGIMLMIGVRDTNSPSVGLNMVIPYAAVPIGSFLMIVFLVEGLFKMYRAERIAEK